MSLTRTGNDAMSERVLEVRGLSKRFPGVIALDAVSFDLMAGEVHGLCGENGAGKSTLIKVLSGIHASGSYEGQVLVGGQPVAFRSIADAEAAGIAVIYQELARNRQESYCVSLWGCLRWQWIHTFTEFLSDWVL